MIKLLVSVVLVLTVFTVTAQEFRTFKVGVHAGYAIPSTGGGGLAFAIEPAYRLSDQIAVGLRYESAATVSTTGGSSQVSFNGSYTVNGNYYFSDNDFRPFAGMGLGWFIPASISTAGVTATPSGVFGFYPRVGFDYKHLNVLVDYNLSGKSELVTTFGATSTTTEFKTSYISLKVGFTFGGGTN